MQHWVRGILFSGTDPFNDQATFSVLSQALSCLKIFSAKQTNTLSLHSISSKLSGQGQLKGEVPEVIFFHCFFFCVLNSIKPVLGSVRITWEEHLDEGLLYQIGLWACLWWICPDYIN